VNLKQERLYAGDPMHPQDLKIAAREGAASNLSPNELGLLAKKLANSSDATEVARLKERLARGFYGISPPDPPDQLALPGYCKLR
jgi:hypothetical protein